MNIFGVLIVRPMGLFLMWVYEMVNNYGYAIILFALLAKLILAPLYVKSRKSMVKMQSMQKQMTRIQKQYATNRVKMNEEIQKLYEHEGVSPMSGCLTNFIQLPIMMGLYYAIIQPLTYMLGMDSGDISLLAAHFPEINTKVYSYQIALAEKLSQFFDANGVLSQEIASLSDTISQTLVPLNFDFFGINLATTPDFKSLSILWLIPILSGVTALLSTVIMQKMQGTEMQGSMKIMFYMMPLMSVYFGFILPAGIGIYWITNNILMIVQELVMSRIVKPLPEVNYELEGDKKKKKNKKQGA